MSNCIHQISDYNPSEGDNFFFDTNIWLFIHGPIVSYQNKRVETYSKLLSKLQFKGFTIYINEMVISEFVNGFARIEFHQQRKKWKLDYNEFKKFRQMDEFKPIASEIAIKVRKIVRASKICDHEISDWILFDLADYFEKGNCDFNDLIFKNICSENNFILVTDDGDFRDSGVQVLTANEKLC